MAIERDTALRQAEKLLRQGKLDGAIEQYVRLLEDHPQDWNAVNALGDLYVRAGKQAQAVVQFTRIADHEFFEGFFQKAAALYKKALKIDGSNEHVLMQLAAIGERQGKFADAKFYLHKAAAERRARGDAQAAAECIVRLGSLEGSDVESKIAAAGAVQQFGDSARAVELLTQAADMLVKAERRAEALEVLGEAAKLDPSDAKLKSRLARELVAAGQSMDARAFLSADSAGDDPDLLLALATAEFADGREDEGRTAMTRVLALAPDREPGVMKLAGDLMDRGRVESAFACVDATTDAVLLQGDLPRAAELLRIFVERVPHIPAFTKLMDIATDANLEIVLREAQVRLTDAYLDAGLGEQARRIAEDLLRAAPADEAHIGRLRRALTLVGDAGVETTTDTIAGPVEPDDRETVALDEEPVMAAETGDEAGIVDLFDVPDFDVSPDLLLDPPPAVPDPPFPNDDALEVATVIESTEIDLSTALAGLTASPQLLSLASSEPVPAVENPAPDLEDVFARMRVKAAREQQASAALSQYEHALQYVDLGLVKEAITALEGAARVPMLRFKAAAKLGRLLVERGEIGEGIEWLERAAEVPPPTPEEGHAVLYDLAGALESQGEHARALAILLELESEAGRYRDVRERIVGLSRTTARGRP